MPRLNLLESDRDTFNFDLSDPPPLARFDIGPGMPADSDVPFHPPKPTGPFRWNPFDKSDYKNGYSPTVGREIYNFWSVLYGTKPTPLNVFSATAKAIKIGADVANEQDAKKFTKPMLQLIGYKVRAGLLDFSPFALGRALDQAGRRVNILTNPVAAFAKWVFFIFTLPLYVVAKALNVVKGVVASVMTLVALPFLLIKYAAETKQRDAGQAKKAQDAPESSANRNNLANLGDLVERFGRGAGPRINPHQHGGRVGRAGGVVESDSAVNQNNAEAEDSPTNTM